VNYVAKWDGLGWAPFGNGTDSWVSALSAFNDGSGPALALGGNFANVGGIAANHSAKWDGANWSALGNGMNGVVHVLAMFDDGSGPALHAGGSFSSALDSGDSYLAKWGNPIGCGTPGVSICEPGVGGVIVCPCSNAPINSGIGCDNSSLTGGAELVAAGIAKLSYDTVLLTSSGERPTATSIVLQGSNAIATGSVFGQGVRCVSGALKRLYVKNASAGSITAPLVTDQRVHARSAALGDVIAPGTHRYYAVYYRDPIVLGACPASSTFNITQQLDVLWSP
jgi:hypothetical protein